MNGEKATCLAVTVLMSRREKQEEGELGESVNSLKSLVLIRAELSRRSDRFKVRRKQAKNNMPLSFS